jgi:ribosomal protein L4
MPRKQKTEAEKAAIANETKRGKFVRLANERIERAYGQITSLGKLGTSAYDRTAEDVQTIRDLLHREVDLACDKLAPGAAEAGGKLGPVLK